MYDIKNLTIDEKINMLVGDGNWKINNAGGKLPRVFMADGPSGLRKKREPQLIENTMPSATDPGTVPATVMPSLSTVSYTWDPELAFLGGKTIADECVENDVDMLLAPGINIKRTPLCGRNFEYVSEDPYLAGIIGKAFIEGVQSKGVGTSLKHFYLNNREFDRLSQSSEVDERTMREIYTSAYEIALEAKPWSVMCAYNPINGILTSENGKILNTLLRKELGFDGVIVSDWGAVSSAPRAIKASLDLIMPHNAAHVEKLREAYAAGYITEEEIDERVTKLLEIIEKAENAEKDKRVEMTRLERHNNAVKIAREGLVLLKNENNVLPLKEKNVFVLGEYSEKPPICGGGSALAQSDFVQRTLAEELNDRVGEDISINVPKTSMLVGTTKFPTLIRRATPIYTKAYENDAIIICVGNNALVESEMFDRETIRLSSAIENVIINTARFNKNVIVVLYTGSAVDMTPWIDKVSAVLLAGFSGEGVTEAVADIISGKVSPSGKLTETYPLSIEDTPTGLYTGNGFYERYTEGVLVGYRWYDTLKKDVLFPFGYGLSYASFEYSDLEIEKLSETDYNVSFNVTNTSEVDAKEVCQLYVSDIYAMVERPEKELKGFSKVALKAGETKRVTIKLDYKSFAYYSVALDKWHVENGPFEILVGASSRDIRLSAKIDVNLPFEEQFTLPF